MAILRSAHEDFDEIYSSGYSNLTYLDVEQRRLRQASDLLGFTFPLTIERDLPDLPRVAAGLTQSDEAAAG